VDEGKKSKVFSYRVFCRLSGFKSPIQLMHVIKGERDIYINSIGKYLKVLKLRGNEKKYFELLVRFNQAKDMSKRTELFYEISTYWIKKGKILEKEHYKYWANWYSVAIREMVNLKHFNEDGKWISKELNGLITPAQAEEAIKTLLELKLLKRNRKGSLVQDFGYVTSGDQVADIGAYLFYRKMLELAGDSLMKKPAKKRNISALTFTLRQEDYDVIVDKISKFRKEICAIVENREVKDEDQHLYHLNMLFFPLTESE